MLLQKYTDTNGADILFNTRMKISDPYDFNDPFEHAMRVIAPNTADIKKKLKNKIDMRRIYDKLTTRGDRRSWKEFKNEFSDRAKREN